MNLESLKRLNPKLSPLQHPSRKLFPSSKTFSTSSLDNPIALSILDQNIEMHYIQVNIEVMILTLICSENKTANSTGLKQLHLKVLDDPLPHGCCHPMCERIVSCSNQGDND